eukprot:CAMPEP_0116839938 /NCGR_PEP_ID=MMETSP0418-20121206/10053_1 /TAXON_ID=1158023 /ORGANISM="Astrosyne radiata, Strain 13vi08-1A" /LENGTH=170 /DNA_ID=CAMNT_0004470121 /DNA_START=434 /DNA_END=946 /DNA_ORIENTATION=-
MSHFPTEPVQCGQQTSGNTCVVVQGEMTLFTDGNAANEEETVLTSLQANMDNGDFNDPEQGIERVSYVDLGATPRVVPAPESSDRGGNGSTRDRALVYGIVAGVAAALIGLAAFAWRRRQQDDEEDSESEAPPVDSHWDMMDANTGRSPPPAVMEEFSVTTPYEERSDAI